MKRIYTFCILLCLAIQAKADHITGGEIYYTYSMNSNGTINYNITFKLFMRCNSNRQFNNPAIVSIFERGSNQRYTNITVNLSSSETISITDPDPCITNPPEVCYVVGYYNFVTSLPLSPNGYLISSQVNYRIAGIDNLQPGYSNIGATYTAEIPGTTLVGDGPKNNSAKFTGSDLVVVCANNRFSYSFAATDPDDDVLHYSFCSAYRSGGGGNMVVPPPNPPYSELPYGNGFSGSSPMGFNVEINHSTGLITGTAPDEGIYVVTVCVDEVRNGKVIAQQRKDLQIKIAACNKAAAILQPDYMLCDSTKTLSLVNLASSPLIKTFYWQLTNRAGAEIYSSSDPAIIYTFADTGSYYVKLVINRGAACTDSSTSVVRVYPGFAPAFNFSGICYTKPTIFTDASTTYYGKVSSWSWDFDSGDFSNNQNPVNTYNSTGTRNVQLVVQNTVGCRDTVTKQVNIVTAPPIALAFSDTLLCVGDPLTLKAEGSGLFTWKPDVNTLNANSATPTVTPLATTTYTVQLNDNGCINNASVLVRVTDHVNLQVMKDTVICKGDTIQLRLVSDAFKYTWFPAGQLDNANVANPFAITSDATTYGVTAAIGSCKAEARVKVTTVPYPAAKAGNDTIVCYHTPAFLNGFTDGSSINWSPAFSLNNAHIINPKANPLQTTGYILSAYDNKGCPKMGSDTVLVTVLPDLNAFAGNDTSVIVEQTLQLKATGGTIYEWSPSTGLSATNVANPVAQYNEPFNGLLYKVLVSNEAGCSDSAFVTVKVFNTGPTIFVPTAFTPNADGKNDVLRPIAVGIQQIDFFQVYNRWGQLVFKTSINGYGWDGTINGVQQATGTYVWVVKAVDYNGNPYLKKGTVILIK